MTYIYKYFLYKYFSYSLRILSYNINFFHSRKLTSQIKNDLNTHLRVYKNLVKLFSISQDSSSVCDLELGEKA